MPQERTSRANKMKRNLLTIIFLLLLCSLLGCGRQERPSEPKTAEIKIAAAASLEKILTQKLIPIYQQTHPDIKISGTYASSGKLQTQIEQGLRADIFISAAAKQMNSLEDKGLIASSQNLLKNELVLIVPAENGNPDIKTFYDFPKARHPAIGDPKSVPAGQYAKEALTALHLWNKVEKELSLGTNVVEVLNWVAEGSADAGLVYATDAAGNPKVKIVAVAPADSLKKPVIYPVGILKHTADNKAAADFIDFLCSQQAQAVFRKYGFQKP